MPTLFRDYETRSTLDLRIAGAWTYASHPTTDVWCCSYAVDDGPIELWTPGDAVPVEFIAAAQNPDWYVSAFNDGFERAIEQHIMAPRYGWTTAPIQRHRCSQAAALALALPATLDGVARALDIPQQKDAAGRNTMLRMARPRKPRRDEDPAGIYWFDDLERRAQLYAYCKQDTATERAIAGRIGSLSQAEQDLWVLDAIINARGICLDTGLLSAAITIADAAQTSIAEEIARITNGEVRTIDQTAALLAWLGKHGCEVPNVQKIALEKALTRLDLPATTRRAIELRLDGAHAAVNKLTTMRAWCGADGRVRNTFRYHGASTGRWTSFGIQLQNLKRPQTEDLSAAIEAVATGDLAHLRSKYPQPMAVLGDIARAIICAAPGHRLIAADLSGVESRITAWVSGQQSKLDQWATFDWSQDPHDEPYYVLGKRLGQPSETARSIGKTADLAFGYAGGAGAWKKLAGPDDTASEVEIKARQQAWRDAHPETKKFWYALDKAAVRAIQKPGTVIACRRVAFEYADDFLFMQLPSGRRIAYPFAKLITNDRGHPVVVFMDNDKGQWVEHRHGLGAYGGIWIENAVQAIARDLFAAAMPRLEAAGYPIVLHVHDEIVAEVPDGVGSAEDFLRILTMPPTWADGLPIAAKVRNGLRFAKINNPAPTPTAPPCEAEPMLDKSTSKHGNGRNEYQAGEREWGQTQAQYIYRDAAGENYLRVVRTSAKQFPQSHWEGDRWIKGKPAGPKLPYRLPELIAAPAAEPVFICEGEKDADNVAGLGLVATTNPEGAGKWCAELNRWFVGKQMAFVLEDNDEAGRAHATGVAAQLQGIVAVIRVVSFPELPPRGDVSDWIEQGGGKTELLTRAHAAPRVDGPTLHSRRASAFEIEEIFWLWPDRFALGKLGILAGLPDEGKGLIIADMAARVTRGSAWPCNEGYAPQGNVILLSAEDDAADTVVPRLKAAGADCDRIEIVSMVRTDNKDRLFSLVLDLDLLRQKITKVGNVKLVLIDPILAYLGVGKVDSFRTADVRAVLGPVTDLANDLKVAIVGIMHFNKKTDVTNALLRISDSLAFGATARHVFAVVNDAENHRKLFVKSKNNLARYDIPTLAYTFGVEQVGIGRTTGNPIMAPHIMWQPEYVDVTAIEAMQAANDFKSPAARDEAKKFLADMLAKGPVLAAEIHEAAEANGIASRTLARAKGELRVIAKKESLGGGWTWQLPP